MAVSNLKQVALAIKIYGLENDDRAPAALEELRAGDYLDSRIFDRAHATDPKNGPIGAVEYLLDGGEILSSLAADTPPRIVLRRRFDKKVVIEVRADCSASVVKRHAP